MKSKSTSVTRTCFSKEGIYILPFVLSKVYSRKTSAEVSEKDILLFAVFGETSAKAFHLFQPSQKLETES